MCDTKFHTRKKQYAKLRFTYINPCVLRQRAGKQRTCAEGSRDSVNVIGTDLTRVGWWWLVVVVVVGGGEAGNTATEQ